MVKKHKLVYKNMKVSIITHTIHNPECEIDDCDDEGDYEVILLITTAQQFINKCIRFQETMLIFLHPTFRHYYLS